MLRSGSNPGPQADPMSNGGYPKMSTFYRAEIRAKRVCNVGPVRWWCMISAPLNFFSQLFHVVAWSNVSILRYLYIVKTDWLHQTFPDPAKLKVWGINYHLIIIIIFYYDKLRSIGPKVHQQIKDVANSSKQVSSHSINLQVLLILSLI